MKFVIDGSPKRYLAVQCGGLSHLLDTPDIWHTAYENYIEDLFEQIKPVLPASPRHVLDVAGGMSGISARLNKHYELASYSVLDGKTCDPVVKFHDVPFNNATATQMFLDHNGVRNHMFFAPEDELDRKFGLVLSFQGWCFHIEPARYLARVKAALAPGAVVILDVRNSKSHWIMDLIRAFGLPTPLLVARKWTRVAFTPAPA